MRCRAILYSLWFGLMPYWVYEKKKHYSCSWEAHLWINARYAWRWATFQEDETDVQFERETNSNVTKKQTYE